MRCPVNAYSETDLDPKTLPRHVAIIMDGNGRWAKKRLLNRVKGHEKGVETVRNIVRTSRKLCIPILTLFAFSTENWQRPQMEVSALMALLKRFLVAEKSDLMKNNIRLHTIGQTDRLPEDVKNVLYDVIRDTSKNTGMILNLALSYGSRAEMTDMVIHIAEKVKAGEIEPEQITPELVSDHLYTSGMADPDLLIRTSGEMRISNFLLWQIAYAEIFVTETLWPDFNPEEFLQILKEYQLRERRFGKVLK